VLREWRWDVVLAVAVVLTAFYLLYRSLSRKRRVFRQPPGPGSASCSWRTEEYRAATVIDIRERLGKLEELVNSLFSRSSMLQSRLERLEDQLTARFSSELTPGETPTSLGTPRKHTLSGTPPEAEPVTFPKIPVPELGPGEAAPVLSNIVTELLAELNAKGRASDVARLGGLRDWLSRCAPRLREDAILTSGDLWLLVVITADSEKGLVIPTLDTVVGPEELLFKWFECKGYDGMQPLKRADVVLPANAVREPGATGWSVAEKGLIDRTRGGSA